MRNEKLHSLVVCTTKSQRLFSLAVEINSASWVDTLESLAAQWLTAHGRKMLCSHAANGALTVWASPTVTV